MSGDAWARMTGIAVCAIVVLGVDAAPGVAEFLGVALGAIAMYAVGVGARRAK